MKCSNCGSEVPDTDRFCVHCGNDLEKQRAEQFAAASYCSECGAPLQKDFKFCVACGAPVPDSASELKEPPAVSSEVPTDVEADTSEINVPAQDLAMTGPIPCDSSAETKNENATFSAEEGTAATEYGAKKEKKKKIWLIVLIAVLVLAIIAVCLVFFLPNNKNANVKTVNSLAEQNINDSNGTATVPTRRLNVNSDTVFEDKLRSDGYNRIEETRSSWRNPDLWYTLSSVSGPIQRGNDIIYTYYVELDYDGWDCIDNIPGYYTYVKFVNVYVQNGDVHYEDVKKPQGKILNLCNSYDTDTGRYDEQHWVAGYATEQEALNNA